MHRLDRIVAKLAKTPSERRGDVRAGPDLQSALAAQESAYPDSPRAAVAAILRQRRGAESADLFFIQRAEHPADPWSGHIAFPGGRREPGDASLVATAIRETREEVGIDLAQTELVARLPDVPAFMRAQRGGLVVSAFVFAMREEEVVPLLNREVASTLWVPVANLARGDGRGTYAFTWENKSYDLPCFRLEPSDPSKRVLWGLTYRMLETMFEALGIVMPDVAAAPDR